MGGETCWLVVVGVGLACRAGSYRVDLVVDGVESGALERSARWIVQRGFGSQWLPEKDWVSPVVWSCLFASVSCGGE